jgi:hypothetical protein
MKNRNNKIETTITAAISASLEHDAAVDLCDWIVIAFACSREGL